MNINELLDHLKEMKQNDFNEYKTSKENEDWEAAEYCAGRHDAIADVIDLIEVMEKHINLNKLLK